MFIISNSWNLIPRIVLLISRIADIVQKCICTPNRAMDPTFQMKYVHVQAFLHVTRDIIQTILSAFSGTPFMLLKVILKPMKVMITCKRYRPITPKFTEILRFENYKMTRFCCTLTYKKFRNSLNVLDTRVIFLI